MEGDDDQLWPDQSQQPEGMKFSLAERRSNAERPSGVYSRTFPPRPGLPLTVIVVRPLKH